MSVETMSHGIPELDQLNQIRLDEDLTFRELGDLTGISRGTLHVLLTSTRPQPYERTRHKIRRFLDERAKKTRSRRRRRPS